MGMFSLFGNRSVPPAPSIEYTKPSLDELDNTFTMLRESTAAVSTAAVEAAKGLQDRLQDSLHRFMSTIDALQDIVLVKDGQGRWCTLNTFGQNVLNMHHGEYYQKTDEEIAVEFPRLSEMMNECVRTDTRAWEEGCSVRSEEQIPQLDGSIMHFDVIKTPVFDQSGNRKELLIIGRDVTEIVAKQARTRACFTALNSASDSIVIIDSKQRIYFSNDKFLETFNIDDYHLVTNKRLCDVLPDIPSYEQMWETVQRNQTWSIACPLISESDPECPRSCPPKQCPIHNMTLTVLPMKNGQPKPIYYICTFKQTER